MGDAAVFAAMRSLLRQAGFTEEAVLRHLGIDGPAAFVPIENRALASPMDLLVRLFMDQDPVPEEAIRSLLPGQALETMEALGLTARFPAREGYCYATVALHPVGALYIAADRRSMPDNSPFTPPPDVVYPVSEQTLRFLESLPLLPCGRLLDLGTGSGVAALQAAAGYAAHAWAVDIAARCTVFAEFNRRLNGLENVTVARGDLYEAVAGERFDRIVAHPPYVPVADATFVFRDGGEDGEQVLRRIIEGLPRHLAPGGRFYGFAMASDREGEPLEQRIRSWLGEASGEFDVLLAASATMTPDKLKSPHGGEHRHWERVVETRRVQYFFYGSMLLERHGAPRGAYTIRTHRGPRSGWRETEWLRQWMAAASEDGFEQKLLALRPRLSPRLELRSVHRVCGGRLTPGECTLSTDYPFTAECICQPWIAEAVAGCDGQATVAERYSMCMRRGFLRDDYAATDFARMLSAMIAGGFLELEEYPLPEAAIPPASQGGL